MTAFVALIRAVNVGGAGKLPMKDFRAACEEAALEKVATYVASGNVVFASDKSAAAIKTLLTDLLTDRFGLTKNDVILRTEEALAEAIARNPFDDAASERPKFLHVAFLDGEADAGAKEALTKWSGPERLKLDRDRLYIDFVEGAGRSKLTPAVLDRALKVRHTARNWNTVLKLREMAAAVA